MDAPFDVSPDAAAVDRTTRVDQIYNYIRLSDLIATAGQPDEHELSAVRAAGFKAVINLALRTSDRALEDEATLVSKLGLVYHAIPVPFEAPRSDDYRQFVEVMDTLNETAVFIHCAANKRVTAFLWLYARQHRPALAERAEAAMRRIWTPDAIWQAFLENELGR